MQITVTPQRNRRTRAKIGLALVQEQADILRALERIHAKQGTRPEDDNRWVVANLIAQRELRELNKLADSA